MVVKHLAVLARNGPSRRQRRQPFLVLGCLLPLKREVLLGLALVALLGRLVLLHEIIDNLGHRRGQFGIERLNDAVEHLVNLFALLLANRLGVDAEAAADLADKSLVGDEGILGGRVAHFR